MKENMSYAYFKSSVLEIIQFKVLHVLLILVEYIPIFLASTNSVIKLNNFGKEYSLSIHDFNHFSKASPYYYIRNFLMGQSECIQGVCSFTYIHILTSLALIVFFWIFCFFLKTFQKKENRQNNIHVNAKSEEKDKHHRSFFHYISLVVINFYDLLFFRYGSLIVIDIFVNGFISIYHKNSSASSAYLSIFSLCCLLFYIFCQIRHQTVYVVWIPLSYDVSKKASVRGIPKFCYPFDKIYSSSYEVYLSIMKVVICVEFGLVEIYKSIEFKIVFLNLIIIFLIAYKGVSILMSMFFHNDLLFFSFNRATNAVRIALTIFNLFFILFSFFNTYQQISTCFLIVVFFTLILLTLFLMLIYCKGIHRSQYNGYDNISQICYLLNETYSHDLEINDHIRLILIKHSITCINKNDCLLCTEFLEKNKPIGYLELFQFFYKLGKQKKNAVNSDTHILLKLIYLYLKKNNFKLFSHIYIAFNKYFKNKNQISLVMNLQYMFDIFLNDSSNQKDSIFFTCLLESQNISNDLEIFIKNLELLIQREKSFINSHDYLDKANNLNQIRQKFTETYETSEKSHESRENFHFNTVKYNIIIERYVLECILNRRFSKFNYFDIEMFEECLETYFNLTKNLLLNLEFSGISSKNKHKNISITILSTAEDLIHYKNRNFEDLFPSDFRDDGIKKFVQLLKKSENDSKCMNYYTNFFEFVIQSDIYIEHFTYKFKMFPYLIGNSVIIQGEYLKENNNLMVFEEKPNSNKKSVLHSMSKKISNLLFLHPTWISINAAYHKYLWFEDIFQACTGVGASKHVIDYKNYLNVFTKFTNYLKDNLVSLNDTNLEEVYSSLSQARFHSNIQATLRISTLFDIYIDGNNRSCSDQKSIARTFHVFAISNKSNVFQIMNCPQSSLNQVVITEEDSDKEENNNFAALNSATIGTSIFSTTNLTSTVNFETNNLRTNSYSIGKDSNSSLIYNEADKAMIIRSRQMANAKLNDKGNFESMRKKFKAFTLLILWFNFLTVIVSIIFFIIQERQDSRYFRLFTIYDDFKEMRSFYEHCTLSVLTFAYIGNDSPPLSEMDLLKFLLHDLNIKLSYIDEKLKTFNQELFDFNDDSKMEMPEKKMNYISIVKDEINGLTLAENLITFQESYQRFLNSLTIILGMNFQENPIYMFSINGNEINFTFHNVDNQNISEFQQELYHVIINFDRYIQFFEQCKQSLQNDFLNMKVYKDLTVSLFTIIICVMNGCLLLWCWWYISVARKISEHSITLMKEKIKDSFFLEYFTSKLSQLKVLCMLHAENPTHLIKKIEKEKKQFQKELYKLINSRKKLSDEPNPESVVNKHQSGIMEKQFNKIISPYILRLFLCFTVFFVFVSGYNFILENDHSKLEVIIQYIEQNSELDHCVYLSLPLMEVMSFTNRTDSAMYHSIYKHPPPDSFGYVQEKILTAEKLLETITTLEEEYSTFLVRIENEINFTCSEMFTSINDSITYSTVMKYNINYWEASVKACEMFKITNEKKLVLLVNDMIYRNHLILNRIDKKDYASLSHAIKSSDIWDMTKFILLVFRPIRKYMRDNLFLIEMSQSYKLCSVVITIYFIMNICIDIFIFIAIQNTIIARLRKINKNLMVLGDCLQF